MKTKVSVIIINKNDRGIRDTLVALRTVEQPSDTEIIVVDASDGKLNYIRDDFSEANWIPFVNKDPDRRYTIPEQRNIGVSHANGDVIVFIDANCIPEKDWLVNLTSPIIKGKERVVAGATKSRGAETLHDSIAKTASEYVNECPTINLAFKRSVYDKVGGFDERFDYGSDVDFSWRLIKAGYKIKFVKNAIVSHDWGDRAQEIKREYLYGRARARLYIKNKVSLIKMVKNDPVIFIYSAYILGLPLVLLIKFYPFLVFLLVFKNIRHKPFLIVYNHLIYSWGALAEVISAIISSPFPQARRLKIWFAYLGLLVCVLTPFLINPSNLLKPFIFAGLISTTGFIASYIIRFYRQILWPLRVGVSIAFLMFIGLLSNTILPLFNVAEPLSGFHITLFILPIGTILLFLALAREESISYPSKSIIKMPSVRSFIIPVLSVLFILSSIAGAERLNNGDSNSVMVFSSVMLGVLVLYTALTKRFVSNSSLRFSLFCIALGVLYMYSMRGNLVNGSDVQAEMYVYNLAHSTNHWNLASSRDAYNATLSLTILPTLLSNFMHVSGDYLLKIYYPVFTALSLPVIFSIAKKYLSKPYAYLLGIFFIAQAQFMQQLPALARQEVAFLFFFLLLYVSLSKANSNQKSVMQLFLGIFIVLSHYSTAYVTVLILAGAIIIKRVILLTQRASKGQSEIIKPRILLVIILFALAWYGQITNTSQGLTSTITGTVKGLLLPNQADKSQAAQQVLPGYSSPSQDRLVSSYIHDAVTNNATIPKAQKANINSSIVASYDQNGAPHAGYLSGYIRDLSIIAQQLLKICILGGIILVTFMYARNRSDEKLRSLVSLSISSFAVLLALVLLPQISLNYNFERLYQQLIPIVAVGFFIGLMLVDRRFNKHRTLLIIGTISTLIYLYGYLGITTLASGGSLTLQSSNSGATYNRFYVFTGENDAALFLAKIMNSKDVIVSDHYGLVKLSRDFNKNAHTSEYVYSSIYNSNTVYFVTASNQINQLAYVEQGNTTLVLRYPNDQLLNSKNRIYSNQKASLFK